MESSRLCFPSLILFVTILISFHITLVVSEEFTQPKSEVPFHNLIPRFKMPRGNLLRYQIPQWEVLYFLKYGIVPFIFYDPNFNKTNFVNQVHKFKMYFDDGRPNRISHNALKDEESFKEFLRDSGHPSYNKVTENSLKQNQKLMEEITGLLQAVSDENSKHGIGHEDNVVPPIASLDILMESLSPKTLFPNKGIRDPRKRLFQKRADKDRENNTTIRQSFWDTFIYRYPLTWKYRNSMLLGSPRDFIIDQDLSWNHGSFPYSTSSRLVSLSDLRRYMKSTRIGTRNVNMVGANNGQDDGEAKSGGGGEPRRNGKNFQTQGWR